MASVQAFLRERRKARRQTERTARETATRERRTWQSWSAGAFFPDPPGILLLYMRGTRVEARVVHVGGERARRARRSTSLTSNPHPSPARPLARSHTLAQSCHREDTCSAARVDLQSRLADAECLASSPAHRSELCPPYAPFLGFAGVACAVSSVSLLPTPRLWAWWSDLPWSSERGTLGVQRDLALLDDSSELTSVTFHQMVFSSAF